MNNMTTNDKLFFFSMFISGLMINELGNPAWGEYQHTFVRELPLKLIPAPGPFFKEIRHVDTEVDIGIISVTSN